MIQYIVTITEQPDGKLAINRTSPPTTQAKPSEIATAEHYRRVLDEMAAQVMKHAGGGQMFKQNRAMSGVSINTEWLEFLQATHDTVLPANQQSQLRRSFFSGAFVMFALMSQISGTETEDVACARLEQLRAELELELSKPNQS
jgi:hypothetical protein